jgi:hypothetical protein
MIIVMMMMTTLINTRVYLNLQESVDELEAMTVELLAETSLEDMFVYYEIAKVQAYATSS